MSMEIKNSYNDYKANDSEHWKTQQEKAKEAEKIQLEKAKEAGKIQGQEKEQEKMIVGKDEYISREASGEKPSGLYRLGKDENGNPKVLFDDPKKSNPVDGNEKSGSVGPKDEPEKCIANTDKVEREIKKLKEEKKQLEQQIQRASGDEKKVKQLERKLSQVESELSQKDNDNYRRQNATITQE